MEFTAELLDKVLVLTLSGEVEAPEMEQVRSCLEKHCREPGLEAVLFELAGLLRLTSHLLALIGFYHERLRGRGKRGVAVVGIPAGARRALELSGLSRIIPIFPARRDALEKFSR